MTVRLTSKLVRSEYEGKVLYGHWCPGCGHVHWYDVPRWSFNGNINSPSFTPSLRVFFPAQDGRGEKTLCHYFLTDGVLNFCSDSPHAFGGKNVPLEDIPQDYGFGDIAMKDLPQG